MAFARHSGSTPMPPARGWCWPVFASGDDDVRLFGTVVGDREAPVQPQGRPFVPLGNELVHFFRSDVLRGLFGAPVLHPPIYRCRTWEAWSRRSCGRTTSPRGDQRPLHQRRVHADEGDRDPAFEHHHSGVLRGTLTVAHHALKVGNRGALKLWLFITIVLGFTFLGFQAFEYTHAYSELNLKLSTGVYGSTFFMLTGFHGFHVTIGAIMLTVMLFRTFGALRCAASFRFVAAAWYWHFVDVVWLLLFILVYWL